MLMIDTLTEFTDTGAVTEFEVRLNCIFVEDGRLTAEGIAENVAQTCAARTGYYNKYVLGLPVEIGFIGALRKFRVCSSPVVGERLRTEVVIRSEFFGISMADAKVFDSEGNKIAEGTIKIAVRQNEAEGGGAMTAV